MMNFNLVVSSFYLHILLHFLSIRIKFALFSLNLPADLLSFVDGIGHSTAG